MIRSVNKISSFSTQPTGSITAGSWTDYVKRFAAALLNKNSQNDLTTLNPGRTNIITLPKLGWRHIAQVSDTLSR